MGQISKSKSRNGSVKKSLRKDTLKSVKTQAAPLSLRELDTPTESMSRGRKKRALKRAKHVARKAFVEAALKSRATNNDNDKHGSALGNFSEMEAAAVFADESNEDVDPEIIESKTKIRTGGALKRSQKIKSDAIDVSRFNTLMSISDFASDPMGAIEKHLVNVRRKSEEKEALRRPSRLGMVME